MILSSLYTHLYVYVDMCWLEKYKKRYRFNFFFGLLIRVVQKTHQPAWLGRFLRLGGLGWVTKFFFIAGRVGFGL